jgi:hypothetical protein
MSRRNDEADEHGPGGHEGKRQSQFFGWEIAREGHGSIEKGAVAEFGREFPCRKERMCRHSQCALEIFLAM